MMDHDWDGLTTVFRDIGGGQPTGENAIELDGTALPGAARAVFQGKFQLWSVKSALTFVHAEWYPATFCCLGKFSFSPVPELVRPGANCRASWKGHLPVVKSKFGVNLREKGGKSGDLPIYVFFPAQNVCIILLKGPGSHKAVKRSRKFVTVAGAELGISYR
jgi:hypothetical protein